MDILCQRCGRQPAARFITDAKGTPKVGGLDGAYCPACEFELTLGEIERDHPSVNQEAKIANVRAAAALVGGAVEVTPAPPPPPPRCDGCKTAVAQFAFSGGLTGNFCVNCGYVSLRNSLILGISPKLDQTKRTAAILNAMDQARAAIGQCAEALRARA